MCRFPFISLYMRGYLTALCLLALGSAVYLKQRLYLNYPGHNASPAASPTLQSSDKVKWNWTEQFFLHMHMCDLRPSAIHQRGVQRSLVQLAALPAAGGLERDDL